VQSINKPWVFQKKTQFLIKVLQQENGHGALFFTLPLHGLTLSINLDATHSTFLRLQKLPDFKIPSYNRALNNYQT